MPGSRAEYMRHYRKTEAGQRQNANAQLKAKARTIAMKVLADRYPTEFNRAVAAAELELRRQAAAVDKLNGS